MSCLELDSGLSLRLRLHWYSPVVDTDWAPGIDCSFMVWDAQTACFGIPLGGSFKATFADLLCS